MRRRTTPYVGSRQRNSNGSCGQTKVANNIRARRCQRPRRHLARRDGFGALFRAAMAQRNPVDKPLRIDILYITY
jgi:hypothetical protein